MAIKKFIGIYDSYHGIDDSYHGIDEKVDEMQCCTCNGINVKVNTIEETLGVSNGASELVAICGSNVIPFST